MGDDPPGAVTATLQAYIAGLRRALEPDRQRRAPAAFLVTVGSGYALRVPPEQLDAGQFATAVTAAHIRLAPAALVPSGRARLHRDDLVEVVRDLDTALGLWRGEPYAELEDAPDARAERVRLDELRLLAVEDRALAQVWLGQQATVAAELEALTVSHPLRERLWGLRALALARSGRQADALVVLRQVRTVLDDELGLEPGTELRTLQTAVLRQDPALEWVVPEAPVATPTVGSDLGGRSERPADPVQAPGIWPLVGRGPQLTALGHLPDQAATAGPTFASLVGEPGIGKTRLATELIARAQVAGFSVLSGRCSSDDGAPPLWPWVSVLNGLGAELPSSRPEDPEITQFAAWEQIVRLVLDAAATSPVLLVLDDLHWADPASLRVLRMLAESTAAGQLMVITTWRAHPEPVGPHADLVEMLARRHALRLDLSGLTAAESAEVVQSVTHTEPSDSQAAALRERTEGNPFFLVEYARLAGERGDLARLLVEESAPTAVHDVLTRRLDRLPEQTRTTLRTAAILGRQFDLALLAAATGVDEDGLLDRLEPALAAGLVREDGIDQFTFAHALVRDTTRSQVSVSRRARVHARAAEALEHRPGRETELARHWLAAGPAYAGRAWRAGLAAAAIARRVYAHDEVAGQLNNALRAMDDDPAASSLDRYEVLMQLVDAYRWTADWPELVRTVEQAVDVAEQIGDLELVAQAAISSTIGALWYSARHGGVHTGVIAALRRCLDRLLPTHHPTRCRVMLSLANRQAPSADLALTWG